MHFFCAYYHNALPLLYDMPPKYERLHFHEKELIESRFHFRVFTFYFGSDFSDSVRQFVILSYFPPVIRGYSLEFC